MTRRTLVIVASSSIALLIIALLFIFNIGNVRHSYASPVKRTITTVKNGNWTDGTVWSTGSAPTNYSSDSIVILHSVVLNTGYTVGDQSKTGITIGAAGTLSSASNFTITLEKSASLKNLGTVSGIKLTFNGGATDPASYVTNSGSFSLASGLMSYGLNTVITNSGTFTANGYTKVNSKIINSGTFTVIGGFDSDYGTFTNSGTMSGTGNTTFTGVSLTNTTATSSFSVGSDFTLNYGSNTKAISTVVNAGKINVGTAGTGNLIIHDGNFTNGISYNANNGPTVSVAGSFNIYAGGNNDTNKVVNNGLITVNAGLTAYSAIIYNNDSLTVGTNFVTYATFTVNKMAYLGVKGDFTNNVGVAGSGFNNNGGYVLVKGNFLNNWNATYSGTGGGMSVAGNLVNRGTETGNTDICDQTPNTANDINGTKASTVTSCTYTPPSSGPSALPVVLTTFIAKKEGSKVVLDWHTASEINNDRFEIERSEDGAAFSAIGTVKGNGSKTTPTNYSYIDEHPLEGIAYYRLHQFDFNGKSEYSPMAVIHAAAGVKEQLTVNMYPNPARAGSTIHLDMEIPVAELVKVELVSITGTNIYQKESELGKGKQDEEIVLPGNIKPGYYILNVTYQGQITSKKLQVQ